MYSLHFPSRQKQQPQRCPSPELPISHNGHNSIKVWTLPAGLSRECVIDSHFQVMPLYVLSYFNAGKLEEIMVIFGAWSRVSATSLENQHFRCRNPDRAGHILKGLVILLYYV